ncbi:MAG TPA: DoxX family protein [Kofleriaceae bacterium]|nr:DoxX family protein [Kofleriaceae bacterium]
MNRLLEKLGWAGPLLVRVTLGLVFVTTGWGKLHSLDDVTEFFRSLNIPAPGIQAAFVSTVELVGGLLLIAGLGTRIVSALLVGVMAVAIWTAKLPDLHGVVDLANTTEATYLVMFVWLIVAGAGAASLDRVVGRLLARREGPESPVGVAP